MSKALAPCRWKSRNPPDFFPNSLPYKNLRRVDGRNKAFSHRHADANSLLYEAIRRGMGGPGRCGGWISNDTQRSLARRVNFRGFPMTRNVILMRVVTTIDGGLIKIIDGLSSLWLAA